MAHSMICMLGELGFRFIGNTLTSQIATIYRRKVPLFKQVAKRIVENSMRSWSYSIEIQTATLWNYDFTFCFSNAERENGTYIRVTSVFFLEFI